MESRAPREPPFAVTSLAGNLQALAAWFDANAGKPRVIALLSPT